MKKYVVTFMTSYGLFFTRSYNSKKEAENALNKYNGTRRPVYISYIEEK